MFHIVQHYESDKFVKQMKSLTIVVKYNCLMSWNYNPELEDKMFETVEMMPRNNPKRKKIQSIRR